MTITGTLTRPTARTAATVTALAVALGLAAASWVVVVSWMTGTGMAVGTRLGSYPSFLVMWVTMTAAMMLPAAAPAVVRHARASGRVYAAPLFVASYLGVWTIVGALVGLAGIAYRPHGTLAAGVVAVAVGCYELTPVKRRCRGRCRDGDTSGIVHGLHCVGSTIGLMVLVTALGVTSLAWMAVISVVVLAQRLLPTRTAIDVAPALAIVGLGVWIIAAPMSVPWLTPGM